MKVDHQESIKLYQAIQFIAQQENILQNIRQQLNHQAMFNLKDAFLQVSNHQTHINIKRFAHFFSVDYTEPSVQAFFGWNNHHSSLNLAFSQFSALLISRQNKLLTKMVIDRQQMGAIPNFLMDLVKKIINQQIKVHQFCLDNQIQDQVQLMHLLEEISDEEGQVDEDKLQHFMNSFKQQSNIQALNSSPSLFLRYLTASGNVLLQDLKYLWSKPLKSFINIDSMSPYKQISYINHHKSHLSATKSRQIRTQYFDCLNRCDNIDIKEIRQVKSIEKHIKRVYSVRNLDGILGIKNKNKQMLRLSANFLIFLLQIMMIEKDTERVKIKLRLSPDFYPILFFQSIPKDRNGLITPINLKDYLQLFGHSSSIFQIYLVFKRYESQTGKMSFNEFCSIFDVSDSQYNLMEKDRFVQSLQDISLETKKTFFKLFKKMMQNQQRILKIKQKICLLSQNITTIINQIFESYENTINFTNFAEIYRYYININLDMKSYRLLEHRLMHGKGKDELLDVRMLIEELSSGQTNWNYYKRK